MVAQRQVVGDPDTKIFPAALSWRQGIPESAALSWRQIPGYDSVSSILMAAYRNRVKGYEQRYAA
jgi:hypothetical protein